MVALPPIWPNPAPLQVTLAERGDVGLTRALQWGGRDLVLPHSLGNVLPDTHPHQGHPQAPKRWPSARATCPCPPAAPSPVLSGPVMGLHGASPGNWSRLKITLFFWSSLTPAAFARLALSTKLQCQFWHKARGTIIFGKGACFKCSHITLRKLASLVVQGYRQHQRCLIASEKT